MMQKRGWVRIIGGKWRGRRLPVPANCPIRPTPDRVRETLFNWISPAIAGSRCLDLFAGTGALGFEALSRGAQYVEMVDQSREVIIYLQSMIKELKAENISVYQAKAPAGLPNVSAPFDIIFLDPPFGQNLLLPACYYLEEKNYISHSAYIYLESERVILENELPAHWQMIKSKQAGQVAYHLIKRVIKRETK
jgi:16S rRNA (guanine966-N2)-methyltransferase